MKTYQYIRTENMYQIYINYKGSQMKVISELSSISGTWSFLFTECELHSIGYFYKNFPNFFQCVLIIEILKELKRYGFKQVDPSRAQIAIAKH